MKLGIVFSVVLYGAGVGMLALLRSVDLLRRLTTPEMFFGPAITIASAWILFTIVHALLGRKKTGA